MNIHPKTETLAAVLRRLRADGWVLGRDVATAGYAQAKLRNSNKAPSVDDLNAALSQNWDDWTPGNRGAAELVEPPGGLRNLLDRGQADIKGIDDTTLDRIGTNLADALNTGSAFTTLADTLLRDNMLNTINDPQRAQTIAVTEMSRALNTSAMNSYKEYGVEKVEWLALEPCDDCEENDGEVRAIDEDFPSGDTEPPVHPNCRCTILPVIDDSAPAGEGDAIGEGDLVDGEGLDAGELTDTPTVDETPSEAATVTADDLAATLVGVDALTGGAISDAVEGLMASTGNFERIDATAYADLADAKLAASARANGNTFDPTTQYAKYARDKRVIAANLRDIHADGPHTMSFHKDIAATPEQIARAQKSFHEALAQLPEWRRYDALGNEKGYAVFFEKTSEMSARTNAYTWFGADAIYVNPRMLEEALGAPVPDPNHWHMPAYGQVNPLTYTFAHEFGHTVDTYANSQVRGRFSGALKRKFPGLLSRYGAQDPAEAYAEIFADWAMGNRTEPLAAAMADKYGWNMTKAEYDQAVQDGRVKQWQGTTKF
jgi:SPP1 gp7 family putative phage head morphogenesis protein